jgi:hypothetical protein
MPASDFLGRKHKGGSTEVPDLIPLQELLALGYAELAARHPLKALQVSHPNGNGRTANVSLPIWRVGER